MSDRSINYTRLPLPIDRVFCPISPDRNDVDTQINGLYKRFLRDVPPGDQRLITEFSKFVGSVLCKDFVPLSKIMSFDEWLESTSYNLTRKERLREEFEALKGSCPSMKQRQRIKSFVKLESYPVYKQCRWINSRSDAFKVYSGPAFKSIEEEIYKRPQFVKHLTMDERSQRVRQLIKNGFKYASSDFTAFESHFVPKLMAICECQLYSYMLSSADPNLAETICHTLIGRNRGSTRAGVHFSCYGRRMSGDMCTSLGNGFTNYMLWSFLFSKHQTIWDGVFEGDDGLVAYKGECPTAQEFESLGFTIKIEHHEDPLTASFCGIIMSNQRIRDPTRFLQTFNWTEGNEPSARVRIELLRAKALSAIYETPGCPIITALAVAALSFTNGHNRRFKFDGYHEIPRPTVVEPIELETRLLFQSIFNINVSDQEYIEDQLRDRKSVV